MASAGSETRDTRMDRPTLRTLASKAATSPLLNYNNPATRREKFA